VWATRYGQRAWLRQLEPPASRSDENSVLRTIARLDGTPFPSTAALAGRWLRGRAPASRHARKAPAEGVDLESAYCAEVVALTYESMGLLDGSRRAYSYDPGSFWSGDHLILERGARLGGEIVVDVPL
jgi:hypothetical protein